MEQIRVIKDGLTNTREILGSLKTSNGKVIPICYNKQILDPFTSLIKLALLNFKKKGTKISINSNRISFQIPDTFQGVTRWKNGDNRIDLHNLCNPIERAVEWYDCDENENIKIIFTLAISGLKRLRDGYTNQENANLVCDAILHYISILEGRLESKTKPTRVVLQTQSENNINTSLKNMWEDDEIAIINSLLVLSKKRKYEQNIIPITSAIECLLEGKDTITHEIIVKYTTSL